MSVFLWTPFSITYLVQLILLILISGYFLIQYWTEGRNGKVTPVTRALTLTFVSLSMVVLFQFLSRTVHPDYSTFILPWVAPPSALALGGYLQFAYHMPKRLTGPKSWERRLVLLLSGLYVCVEAYVAVDRAMLHAGGYVEFRPRYLDIPILIGLLWALIVLVRQFTRALAETSEDQLSFFARVSFLMPGKRVPRAPASVRAFVYVTLFPLSAVLVLTLRSHGMLGGISAEVVFCWIMLFLHSSFALAYLSYMPERTTFMLKLAGVTLTTMLVVLGSVSWLIGPTLVAAYDNESLVAPETTIRFEPTNDGGYSVQRTNFRFDERLGAPLDVSEPLDLPFSFPFFGEQETTLFIHAGGFAGFRFQPYWRDAIDRFGGQPGLYPLAVDLEPYDLQTGLPSEASGIFVNSSTERVLVTWLNRPITQDPTQTYSVQMALYPKGVIEFVYASRESVSKPTLLEPHSAPMFVGITPGWLNGSIERVNLNKELPLKSAPHTAIMSDYRLDFLAYLSSLYWPIALFLVFVSVCILIAIPTFLHANLVAPLRQLLGGVDRFQSGNFKHPIQVKFRDEIGFLTQSFNDLAKDQQLLIDTLESRVTERSEAASTLAAENARLEERNHLSRELHDAVSQTLFSSTLIADTLPRLWQDNPQKAKLVLDDMRRLNRSALAEMRHLLLELRPSSIMEKPLGELLRELGKSFKLQHSLKVSVTIESDGVLPEQVQLTFYRIAQESLNNIAKHAQAQNVSIHFDALTSQAFLSVADDGIGFNLNSVPVGHMGLQIMRERVEKIGGTLEINTELDTGTVLTVIWFSDDST